MAIIQKRKLVGLTTVGLLSLTLGGTGLIAPSVLCPPVVAEAALRTQTVTEAKADLQKTVDSMKAIAEKNPSNTELQTLYKNATKALKDSKATVDDLQSYSLALSQYFEGYNLYGSKKNEDPGKDEEAIEAGDNHGGDGVEDNSSSTSDPIADTQDAHEYEESTAQADNNQGSSDSNSDSNATNNASSQGGSNSTNAASSSTKPNSHSSSAFSEESVNAPGNAGRHVSSSSASSTTPAKANTTKKGNLPGTGEDSRNVVLISVIGILSILGLGGTALALWLRQRKHVNNE